MKGDKKTLSDKNKCLIEGILLKNNYYQEKDVKQFIKDLKEEVTSFVGFNHILHEKIDKLAGSKLT